MSGFKKADVRVICFYLPQFHPFPENDEWWGKGFSEWTNVTRAQPLFVGHYQPHLPADLGFYDLRVSEIRHQQINMAKAYGIDAFCYHFYWFSGKRLMERPLDDMLADKDTDMPFCLCWANENWTRRWDASENSVLIAQQYRDEDPVASIQALEPYLRDPRYVCHQGKKIIVVYRPQHLPNSAKWMQAWRDYARQVGLGELHLVCALTHGNWSYKTFGFDAGVEFPPHNSGLLHNDYTSQLGYFNQFEGAIADHSQLAEFYLTRDRRDEPLVHRTVYPSWDNTARRKQLAYVTLNATPENYEYWLHRAIEATSEENQDGEGLVFINAWNEWAEGCHLEPDQKYGYGFLEATKRAREGSLLTGWTHTELPKDCGKDAQQTIAEQVMHLIDMDRLTQFYRASKRAAQREKLRNLYLNLRLRTRGQRHAIRQFSRKLRGKTK